MKEEAMDILQIEKDSDEALDTLYAKQCLCAGNRFACEKLAGASAYLNEQLYRSMQAYFADPEPISEMLPF